MKRALLISALFIYVSCTTIYAIDETATPPVSRQEVLADLVRNADSTWRRVTTPGDRYGVRSLFTSMLAYTEANTNSDRVAIFIEKAESMQERNPEHRQYGNFFWYASESEVLDANAVDFCMQHAALLWMFHQDKLDPELRRRFHKMITLGLYGLTSHRPRPTYTNIALLNASDLILLGQALDNPEAIKEGSRRLNVFLMTLWEEGVHEYTSPTYYGINMESALLLEALVKDPAIRKSATAIRKLFEYDIALNRHAPYDVLAGSCSRTYDFLYRQGELQQILVPNGWLKRPLPKNRRKFHFRFFSRLYAEHLPAPEVTALTTSFPRTVKQRWGFSPRTTRTHHLCKDVTLGTSASIYGKMDIPLAVNLLNTGDKLETQLYFLPDGRNDPYGKKRISAGNHNKALHLTPWWAAAQQENEALALVLYDSKTFKHITDKLQSHIVFRKKLDGVYIDNRQIDSSSLASNPEHLKAGQTFFILEGSAAIAIQIPWAQGQGDSSATTTLIDDKNKYDTLRLTVEHTIKSLDEQSTLTYAGAVFRVRTGSGIISDKQFADFRKNFKAERVHIARNKNSFKVSVNCEDKAISIETGSLTSYENAIIFPQPSTAVLSMNGEDIGRKILEESPVIRTYVDKKNSAKPITVFKDKPTTWYALAGAYTVPLETANDHNKKYIWAPEKKGERGWSAGTITWVLNISKPGTFQIEAEILAPTPEDDSFYISGVDSEGNEAIPEFTWSTGTGKSWRWSKVINRSSKPYRKSYQLPAGKIKLIFRSREAGTKISRLRLIPQ